MADEKHTDEEFQDFGNLDEAYADPAADDALLDDNIDDAEFQDMADALNEDVFEEEQPAEKPKKKVNWFNMAVALGAVLVAGGLIAMKIAPQFLGGGAAVVAQAPMADAGADANAPASPEAAAQAALAPMPAPNGAAPTAGMLDSPDAFAQLAEGAAPDPAQNTNTIPDPFAAMNKAQPDTAAADNTPDVPMPAPIAAEPVVEAAPIVPSAPVMPVAAEGTPSVPVAPVAAAVDTAAVSAVQGQVNALSSRMDSIESKLDAALSAASQTQAASAPANDQRFDRIQSALERLETRLDDMASSRRTTTVAAVVDDQPAPVKKAKKVPAKTAKKADNAYDEPYKAAAPAASVTPVASKTASNWTLRGAQPGQAIIAQAGGDIRQVSIGDSVPGIGQVTGIAQMNGRWVVQGTQGRINQ